MTGGAGSLIVKGLQVTEIRGREELETACTYCWDIRSPWKYHKPPSLSGQATAILPLWSLCENNRADDPISDREKTLAPYSSLSECHGVDSGVMLVTVD